jgi:hypothetical protein
LVINKRINQNKLFHKQHQEYVMSELYKTHLVAFIDLLGFEKAVETNNKNELILKLLQQMKFFNNETEGVDTYKDEQGNDCTVVHPKVITFSDCIVISISNEQCSWKQAVIEMKNHLLQLARIAHYRGFLLRGGITIGALYHQDNIIFGPALNAAYKMEREIAKNPKIILSKTVFNINLDDQDGKHDFKLDNSDKRYYFDYLPILMQKTDPGIDEFVQKVKSYIEENLINFELTDDRVYKKWLWFKHHFETASNNIIS